MFTNQGTKVFIGLLLGFGFFWTIHMILAEDLPSGSPPVAIPLLEISSPNWSTNTLHEISAAILDSKNWKGSSRSLMDWLETNYSSDSVSKPAWFWISGLQHWCELFSASTNAVSQLDWPTTSWLLEDPDLTANFFSNLSSKNWVPEAIGILKQLHQNETDKFPKYDRLAIAMAFVWDKPRSLIPHGQVPEAAVLPDPSSVLDKFRFWTGLNEKKIAEYDLSSLEVGELKFVVDATAPLEELQWAQTSARFGRSNFGQAFFAVKYDEPRLDRGEYVWPYPSYSLKEIRKRGGICVDQAYFAAMAGKANGIPTLFFTGEGRRGPHAWFGYKSDFRWIVDSGRYQYDKYATGTAMDPQTGEPISDHEIAFLAEAFRQTREYQASQAHLRQAVLFQEDKEVSKALSAVDSALKLSPKNLEAWNLKTELLQADTNNVAAIQAHFQAMTAQFSTYPDIKVDCEKKMADLALRGGNTNTVAQIEDQIIRENRSKRHDLSMEVFHDKMLECCQNKDWKGGRAQVHEAIIKFHDEVGDVFKLLHEFVYICLQNNQHEEASQALKDFKNRVKPDPIVERQVEQLQKEVKDAGKAQRGFH